MSTTWAQHLSDVRSDLQDTSDTSPRWSTDMLYLYTKDGVRDYSTWFPKRLDHVEISLISGKYPLPLDYVEDIAIEYPADTFLEQRYIRPGKTYHKNVTPKYYFTQGGSIYLDAPVSGSLFLTYNATHDIPADKSDATFVFTIPDTDMELIRLYVKAKVYTQMRTRQSALDRFKIGSGKRDDNPLEPEVADVMSEYTRGIAERVRGGVIVLTKLGPKSDLMRRIDWMRRL